jgi:hypothetical protein
MKISKSSRVPLSLGIIIVFVLFVFGSCKDLTKQDNIQLKVGVAKAVINPPIGSYIAGDKQNRKFTGILDSLYVKAFVAYDGEKSLAIVTVDCIGLLYNDLQKIREETSKLTFNIPFAPANIILSSTHTHSGPDVVGIWGKDYTESGVDPAYIQFLAKAAAKVIHQASENLIPVSVAYAETEFGHEWVANICDEEIDRSVTMLHFLNGKGNTVASITNFACHPTYLDAVITEVSSDYISGFYREMEKQLGGEHLFLQGAIGGWVQPVDKDGNYQNAIKRGKELADATLAASKKSKTLNSYKISVNKKIIKFPVENEGWKQLAAAGIFHRKFTEFIESEIVWFSIGEATFATHPGETAPAFGLQTKALMPEGPKFVLGLGQDALGYILKPEYFEDLTIPHAPYLTRMSLGKNTGLILMDELKKLANEE